MNYSLYQASGTSYQQGLPSSILVPTIRSDTSSIGGTVVTLDDVDAIVNNLKRLKQAFAALTKSGDDAGDTDDDKN